MSETHSSKLSLEPPQHVAIIMDGNGRWAKGQGKSTSYGHRAGVETVRDVLQLCVDKGINIVTLFAFSSENWQRPRSEVSALMTLFASYLKREVKRLHQDGVRVRFIGDRQRFTSSLLKLMVHAEELTVNNTRTTLVLAVDYGGQWDIANACKRVAEKVKAGELEPEQIDENLLGDYISLADLPKPDLCIRTASEYRISNFLLWQLAYSELFFSDVLWPDFGEKELQQALDSYHQRERRFGGRDELQATDADETENFNNVQLDVIEDAAEKN
jgi:undecaprenyl diphosphate synthase